MTEFEVQTIELDGEGTAHHIPLDPEIRMLVCLGPSGSLHHQVIELYPGEVATILVVGPNTNEEIPLTGTALPKDEPQ